jgi:hypothetical protein
MISFVKLVMFVVLFGSATQYAVKHAALPAFPSHLDTKHLRASHRHSVLLWRPFTNAVARGCGLQRLRMGLTPS